MFSQVNRDQIKALINFREGETKVGESIQLPDMLSLSNALASSTARFVLLGLPEDIGVRANGGIGGAATGWPHFLKSFLNIQENTFLSGSDFLLWGSLDFSNEMHVAEHADVDMLRGITSFVDIEVEPVVQQIIAAGKIPIVIGGGHNNAYPLLKGASLAINQPLNAVNLDAHTDFRVVEGRHSGNGFRYAYQEGYLKQYAMLGLHENYNSQNIIAELQNNPDCKMVFWEDIFLRERTSWPNAVAETIAFVRNNPFGVELDVDCIENVLSSAATPVGINSRQAMYYLYQSGCSPHSLYLHLPEGIVERADGLKNEFTGKLLSYLVQSFVKGVIER